MNLKDPLCQVDPNDRSLLQGCLLHCLGTQHHQRGTLRCRRVGASTPSDFASCQSSSDGWHFGSAVLAVTGWWDGAYLWTSVAASLGAALSGAPQRSATGQVCQLGHSV